MTDPYLRLSSLGRYLHIFVGQDDGILLILADDDRLSDAERGIAELYDSGASLVQFVLLYDEVVRRRL